MSSSEVTGEKIATNILAQAIVFRAQGYKLGDLDIYLSLAEIVAFCKHQGLPIPESCDEYGLVGNWYNANFYEVPCDDQDEIVVQVFPRDMQTYLMMMFRP